MAQSSAGDVDLLETGVPGLDRILGGGLRSRATVMVIGPPGLGKTILAQQIAFHGAARGAAALYLTGYSETHDKLVANVRGLSFFAAERIGQQIQFGSLPDLLREGPDQTEDAIVATARAQHASLVVLDGFRSIRGFLADDHVAAGFLYSLGAKLALLGATTLVVVEGDPDETGRYPEMTVCDVILALRRSWRGSRHRRLLEVVKARGSRLLDGIHPFAIDQNGVSVFPRFETVVPTVQQAWAPRLAALGVPELDALLGGGLSAGTTTLVAGGPGVGKTTLGLHFIAEGIRAGEPGLLLGFMESAAQLREKARMFNINLGGAEAAGQLRLLVLPGYDLEADYIATLLREDVEGRGVRRLVVDSTKELERAVDSAERVPDFIAALVSYLRGQDVTTYLTLDIPRIVGTDLDFAGTPLSVMAENLILLRQVEYRGALHRVCSVLKMRFSNHDRALYEYTTVAGEGIRILGPAPLGEGLLTGIARPLVDIPLQRPAIGS